MKIKWTTMASLLALISTLILLCSSLCFCLPRERNYHQFSGRKLVISAASSSTNVQWLSATPAMEQPKKAVESSLKRQPPTGANPIQNK
ncbi:hypothetical protein Nepgr_031200 [Nepenthes gracilis]|uniref:Secreted protein n=1 Tax=Nepenthes gracilis TaxID=150966 RepID=A0AAD3TID5_NEPGR|nr:hypothetical protein Nepgr_031200 [Nepenthes gracilis]